MPMLNANLIKSLVVIQRHPQPFDADFLAAISAFPYVGKPTKGDRAITSPGDLSGYRVRGWQNHMVAADGLQFM